MTTQNKLAFTVDHEHRKVAVFPASDAIIKDIRLVYYSPGVVMPAHSHATAQFSTLLLGEATQAGSGKNIENQPGIAEFKPIDFQHSNKIGPNGAVFLSINIDADHHIFETEFGAVNWNLTETKHAKATWEHLCSMLFHPATSLDADMEEIVLGVLNASMPYAGHVRQAPAWLKLSKQALDDSDLSIAQIADSVGVHRVHLSRVFQAHYGISVSRYRQRRAIQRGIAALFEGKQDIAIASSEGGFADQSHFTRVLKKHFGITPLGLKSLFKN